MIEDAALVPAFAAAPVDPKHARLSAFPDLATALLGALADLGLVPSFASIEIDGADAPLPGLPFRVGEPAPGTEVIAAELLHAPGARPTVAKLRGPTDDPEHSGALAAAFRGSINDRMAELTPLIELTVLRAERDQLLQTERLQHALYAIADLASTNREMGGLFSAMHEIVAGLMYAENFFIALYDSAVDAISFQYFRDSEDADAPAPGEWIPLNRLTGSLTAHVIRTGETLMGPSQEIVDRIGAVAGGYGPQSVDWLGVPLFHNQRVAGAVVVQSYDPNHRFGEDDRTLLTFVAQHIATAIVRRLAHIELEARVGERTAEIEQANVSLRAEIDERQRSERLQSALFRIAELGLGGGSIDTFYAEVHGIVSRLLYAGNFYVAMTSDDGQELRFPYSVDERDPTRHPRPLGRGLTEYVLRTGKPLLADADANRQLHERGDVASHGPRSTIWLGVPLFCQGSVVGVLAVQSYDADHQYTGRDQELLTFVAAHIGNALDRKRANDSLKFAYGELEQRVAERTEALRSANLDLVQQIVERERVEERLKHAAWHDSLTGLPNREQLMAHLGGALADYLRDSQAMFAVLFLDLDRFKVVNDSVGHMVGDELLKEAARRIALPLDDDAFLARLGGDEFAVVLLAPGGINDAEVAAGYIIESLDEPIRLANKELFTSTSIGIVLVESHYRSAEELLRDADIALYRAKATGRRRYVVFDETLRSQALRQLDLEGSLRRAVVREEFEPVFQPIVRLADGVTVGFEALLRWRHPKRGLLAPGDFLEAAEDVGLSEAIDWLMFDRVLAATGQLLAARGHFVSINMGAGHFRSQDLAQRVCELIKTHGLPNSAIRIEVTERTLLEDPLQARALLAELAEAGISIAMDDFGTGYSSLSYLHRFPIHALKIDQSFVAALGERNPGNADTVLRTVRALGDALHLETIAEGIETQAQLLTLIDMGYRYGQGFLFARPESLEHCIGRAVTGEPPRASHPAGA